MKKLTIITVLMTLLCINAFSQIVFENGYFINESDRRIDCLIRNVDWMNNPTSFQYKLTQEDSVRKGDISTVKEFSIIGESKYVRATVKIDKSSNILEKLTADRNPVFETETLFLKSIVEGNATLYKYENEGNIRFFYKKDNSEITQLVFKQYLLNEGIASNFYYKQQILSNFQGQGISSRDVEGLIYAERDLKRFFFKLNGISDSNTQSKKQKRDFFNLTMRPGFNIGSIKSENSSFNSMNIDFGSKLNFRFGIEAEFILPFNKNKWSLILEPTYQYYDSKKEVESYVAYGDMIIANAHYQSIELPLGLRYNIFLSSNSKIFVNASYYIFEITNKSSKLRGYRNDGTNYYSYDFKSGNNFSIGAGYKYKDKYSIELRQETYRTLLKGNVIYDINYKAFSVVFGYSIF